MENRCGRCVYNGSGAIVCSTVSLRNALEELYGTILVVKELYTPRECSMFEEAEEESEEKICESSRDKV